MAGITLGSMFLKLEFLTVRVQVFQAGIPQGFRFLEFLTGGTPQEHVSSAAGVRILNGIAHINREFLCSLLTDFNVSILFACFAFVLL